MKSHLLAAAFISLALAGCARTPPFEPGVHLALMSGPELPPPAGMDATGFSEYRIGPLDKLSVNVYGLPELSREVQADSGGRISLPLAGTIDALGLTPEELSNEVESRLRGRYIRDPDVAVNLEETVGQVVTVDGQVQQPGMYPVVGKMTLVRAVAVAKGATEFADVNDVVVFRTVGDQEMAALYDLGAIRRGNYPDPRIYPGDVVVVGDSPARRRFRDLVQASGVLTAPLLAVVQRF